ncbi:MAG: NERD domain-containing protein [Pyrinomonadaceae bacterium]
MARMIPPYVSSDIKSRAERKVFDFFKHDPNATDYVVLHSLGLSRHIKRQFGEIDFVVLAPGHGVFCLEVKGGRVQREDGVWTFTNRHGKKSSKAVSPFSQAREGMFSLLEAVRARLGSPNRLYNLVYRYGVMFPDIEFTGSDPEFERWEVYDLRDRKRPISEYVLRLSRGAHRQVSSTQWYNATESRPTEKDVAALVSLFRGNFEIIPPPSVELKDAEQELLALTEEQYERLDSLEQNARCLFEGGAGTGKTMIALEFARRMMSDGKRVGIFCFNKLLGKQIRAALDDSVGFAGNLHQFIRDVVVSSAWNEEFLNCQTGVSNEVLYNELYPCYGSMAVRDNPDFQPFDTLIIDEAQDLITADNLDFFDEILRGGINGGQWGMFADFHRQAIYSARSKDEMLDELSQRSPHFTLCKLTRNCRNTRNIGEETSVLSGFEKPPFLLTAMDGLPVDYQFYSDAEDQIRRLNQLLRRLVGDGISPQHITILSCKASEKGCLARLKEIPDLEIEAVSDSFFTRPPKDALTFATIHSFKGLENSVIILTDFDDLSGESARSLLYVGMSRARQRLYMVIPETLREQYQSLVSARLSTNRL